MARGRSNPLALAVLTLLYEKPMHPYEMSRTLRDRRKEDSIKLNYGSLYSVVESLHKRGLITPQETVRDGRRPERTIYAITDAGVREMVSWLSDLVANPVKEYTRFEAALSLLPILPPDDAVRLLESRLQQQLLTEQQRETTAAQARQFGIPRLFMLEDEYQRELLHAEIRYIRALIDEIKNGALPGVGGWRRTHELRAAGLSQDEIDAVLRREFPEETVWMDHVANAGQADPTVADQPPSDQHSNQEDQNRI